MEMSSRQAITTPSIPSAHEVAIAKIDVPHDHLHVRVQKETRPAQPELMATLVSNSVRNEFVWTQKREDSSTILTRTGTCKKEIIVYPAAQCVLYETEAPCMIFTPS